MNPLQVAADAAWPLFGVVPLAVMLFWLVRVRFGRSRRRPPSRNR